MTIQATQPIQDLRAASKACSAFLSQPASAASRESWLAYRSSWRTLYASLSGAIRSARSIARTHGHPDQSWAQMALQGSRSVASSMMGSRMAAKAEARESFRLSRQASDAEPARLAS